VRGSLQSSHLTHGAVEGFASNFGCDTAPGMKLIATSLSIGVLLLTQAEEPKQDRKVVHLTEIPCKTFIEEMKREQSIIVAWLQGYYLPEHSPPVIDVDKLLSDSAKLTEHCVNNPEDDLMTAAEAVFGN
jgi:HdeA/HdeB family